MKWSQVGRVFLRQWGHQGCPLMSFPISSWMRASEKMDPVTMAVAQPAKDAGPFATLAKAFVDFGLPSSLAGSGKASIISQASVDPSVPLHSAPSVPQDVSPSLAGAGEVQIGVVPRGGAGASIAPGLNGPDQNLAAGSAET
eukprot:3074211-Alexandrium_andersonii.AAC.1